MTSVILSLSLFGLNLLPSPAAYRLPPAADRMYQSSLAGNFAYQVEYTTHGVGETPIESFSLFDHEHQLLTSLLHPGVEMVFVSDAGWFAGALNSGDKVELTFFDRKGQVRSKTEADAPANYAFSQAGNYLYVNSARGVQAFDAGGRIAARFGTGAWFGPSSDDRFLALVNRDRLDVYRFGTSIPAFTFRLGTFLFRGLAFSGSGEYLAIAERSTVSLYSLKTPGRVWKKEVDPSASLLALCVDDQGRVYAGGEIARAGFLSLLENGRELARLAIAYTDDHETIDAVTLSDTRVEVKTTSQKLEFEVAK